MFFNPSMMIGLLYRQSITINHQLEKIIERDHQVSLLLNMVSDLVQKSKEIKSDDQPSIETKSQESKEPLVIQNFQTEFLEKKREKDPQTIFKVKTLHDSQDTVRVFRCEEEGCGKVYKSKENLNLHIQNSHLNKKPYKCQYCDNSYSHRNGKIYHERKVHTKIFPYKCTEKGILKLI